MFYKITSRDGISNRRLEKSKKVGKKPENFKKSKLLKYVKNY